MNGLDEGFIAGYACLSARADLLDRINVFPVADGDTGVNLRISLGPLHSCSANRELAADSLFRSATGNSGNIAASFFSEFLQARNHNDLPGRAIRGRERAWQAVADPRRGTMLDVFDTLADILPRAPLSTDFSASILAALQEAVRMTAKELADLRCAGVVDAGALGMYLFFDGFFRAVTGYADKDGPLNDLFPDMLAISPEFQQEPTDSFCVDALVRPADGRKLEPEEAAALGESVVFIPGREEVKLHVHTSEPRELRRQISRLGEIVSWSDQSMDQGPPPSPRNKQPACLHIMTDAAGSLSRKLAERHGITLLDSYVVAGGIARPESLSNPEDLYARMGAGEKVTTAQASLVERHQLYRAVCEEYGKTLYLCVGSAFTGNFETAVAWKDKQDTDDLFTVVDTGAASGRLAVIALLTARYAQTGKSVEEICSQAHLLVEGCREYVFIDVLKYLVAGGRVSRARGFFGDLLHMKPVISPTSAGVVKVGMVRNQASQLAFAKERLREEIAHWEKVFVLLQYSDNQDWVTKVAGERIQSRFPEVEIAVEPLSLTSGVHMGPGTWSIAFGPEV